MDSALANIIVAVISLISSVTVAIITSQATRAAKIAEGTNETVPGIAPNLSIRAQKLRRWGQVMVGVVYVAAIACLVVGLKDLEFVYAIRTVVRWDDTIMVEVWYENLLMGLIYMGGGVGLFFVGWWAKRRLAQLK